MRQPSGGSTALSRMFSSNRTVIIRSSTGPTRGLKLHGRHVSSSTSERVDQDDVREPQNIEVRNGKRHSRSKSRGSHTSKAALTIHQSGDKVYPRRSNPRVRRVRKKQAQAPELTTTFISHSRKDHIALRVSRGLRCTSETACQKVGLKERDHTSYNGGSHKFHGHMCRSGCTSRDPMGSKQESSSLLGREHNDHPRE